MGGSCRELWSVDLPPAVVARARELYGDTRGLASLLGCAASDVEDLESGAGLLGRYLAAVGCRCYLHVVGFGGGGGGVDGCVATHHERWMVGGRVGSWVVVDRHGSALFFSGGRGAALAKAHRRGVLGCAVGRVEPWGLGGVVWL